MLGSVHWEESVCAEAGAECAERPSDETRIRAIDAPVRCPNSRSAKDDGTGPRGSVAEDPALDTGSAGTRTHRGNRVAGADDHHSNSHVEGAEHLRTFHASGALQLEKQRRDRP